MSVEIQPNLATIKECIAENSEDTNMYPIFTYVPATTTKNSTPYHAYLKLSKINETKRNPSVLFESCKNGNEIDRYSFIGVNPRKVIYTGPERESGEIDPLTLLEEEMSLFKQAENIPGIPKLSGGCLGYISYDCIRYFEPKTQTDGFSPKNTLNLPESAMMMFDEIVAFDHVFQRFQVIANMKLSTKELKDDALIKAKYDETSAKIQAIVDIMSQKDSETFEPVQPPIKMGQTFTSNIGQEGYESHVTKLKEHIKKGDIIQAVPSQRIARPTSLHPFNIYKQLRTVNPSPYMFYIDMVDFQVIGASPELLVKMDAKKKVTTHPIAGTIKRGKTIEEDEELANELLSSLKDRSEHVMLVDLARNDINRICDARTTSVDKLLTVQKFSHVQHLVSEVSGTLREDKTRFDAFRSIFPAGTVSGAPKVKAMTIINQLENEKRGVYAGAVGHWAYDGKTMDTCIALRTMVYKEGTAYLQAGGGIVFDSDENDEYVETMNKMLSNNATILKAEKYWKNIVGEEA
ncbi:hypothetical protein QEN19_003483 [Hanseniaspora menglaensis]